MASQKKTVCVIGAGASGVVAAVHLKAAGLDVTVFERSSVAGGVWVFDERRPPEPPYPSIRPSEADFTALVSQKEWISRERELGIEVQEEVDAEVWHAPPGPCYKHLSNNVPTDLMELKINSWKLNTPPNVNHPIIKDYIQDTAAKYNIHDCTLYNTRVDRVSKIQNIWQVQTTTLMGRGSEAKKEPKHWEFNFLVVATGHYHACKVPDIPGLKNWKKTWPTRVKHSKGYRIPEEYKDQTVLLVGASVSSTDIARELGPFAKKTYQVSRGGLFDLSSGLLPENAIRVGEIASFNHNSGSLLRNSGGESELEDTEAIPNTITLVSGEVLEKIDRVLLCTGYHMSFPFLRQYHNDFVGLDDADGAVIVTDGTQMHNLHKDIFYIPDTTLAFIGVPYYVATFSLFEYQAIAVAAVFSGKAKLPERNDMKEEYRQRLSNKGSGKAFHSLKNEEVEYVNSLVEWINRDGEFYGGNPVEGHSQGWKSRREELLKVLKRRYELGRLEILNDVINQGMIL